MPAGSSLKVQLRSSATKAGLASATWYGPTSTSTYYPSKATTLNAAHKGHRYIQYRAVFGSSFGDTPVLDTVAIRYH